LLTPCISLSSKHDLLLLSCPIRATACSSYNARSSIASAFCQVCSWSLLQAVLSLCKTTTLAYSDVLCRRGAWGSTPTWRVGEGLTRTAFCQGNRASSLIKPDKVAGSCWQQNNSTSALRHHSLHQSDDANRPYRITTLKPNAKVCSLDLTRLVCSSGENPVKLNVTSWACALSTPTI
jgi:hypothetical protein